MATEKQRSAARRNIKKAAAAAKRKKTIAHLPKATRTALGKQGAKVRKERGTVISGELNPSDTVQEVAGRCSKIPANERR